MPASGSQVWRVQSWVRQLAEDCCVVYRACWPVNSDRASHGNAPMKNLIEGVSDSIDDVLEKVSGTTGRFGHTGERAAAMKREGLDNSVTAAQLTAASKKFGNNHKYDERFVEQLVNLVEDCESGTPIPKKIAKVLIQDQRAVNVAIDGAGFNA